MIENGILMFVTYSSGITEIALFYIKAEYLHEAFIHSQKHTLNVWMIFAQT